jgi:capsular polysaccharide biosynthesis protein
MEQREDLEINLGFLVREVIRKAWIIVLATIVCAAGMFCFSNFVKDPVYESSVKVYVNNISNKNDSGSISSSEI